MVLNLILRPIKVKVAGSVGYLDTPQEMSHTVMYVSIVWLIAGAYDRMSAMGGICGTKPGHAR